MDNLEMKHVNEISLDLYSKDVIIRTAYDFLDKYNLELILNKDKNAIIVNLLKNEHDKEIFWAEFNKKLIDHSLRQKIFHETKDIRIKLFQAALNESLSKIERDDHNDQL